MLFDMMNDGSHRKKKVLRLSEIFIILGHKVLCNDKICEKKLLMSEIFIILHRTEFFDILARRHYKENIVRQRHIGVIRERCWSEESDGSEVHRVSARWT